MILSPLLSQTRFFLMSFHLKIDIAAILINASRFFGVCLEAGSGKLMFFGVFLKHFFFHFSGSPPGELLTFRVKAEGKKKIFSQTPPFLNIF